MIAISTQGGTNIEEIASEYPEAIIRNPIDIITGLQHHDALSIAKKVGFRNEALQEVHQLRFVFFSYSLFHF